MGSDDRTLEIGMTLDIVGVNGIAPARQGTFIDPKMPIESTIGFDLDPWRTGRMPFAPTGSFVIDPN